MLLSSIVRDNIFVLFVVVLVCLTVSSVTKQYMISINLRDVCICHRL